MTLVELIVAMGILVIVLAVFMAGVVSMARTTVRSESATTANDQFRLLFQRMDREVRYATDINRPGAGPSGSIYIEYRYVDEAGDAAPHCMQMRYDPTARTLQRRSWPEDDPGEITQWSTLVTKLRNDLSDPAQYPFVFHRAGNDTTTGIAYVHQRVSLRLDSGLGDAGDGRGSQLSTTFVARNTSDQSPTNADADGNGVTDHPVCLTTGASRS